MADQTPSRWAAWLAIGVVLLGVAAITAVANRRSSSPLAGDDHQHVTAVMGSARRTVESQPFRSADVTAVMGSSSLDLTRSELQPGQEAVVEVFAMMGNVTIRVPRGWIVDTRAIPVLGALRDERWPAGRTADDAATPETPPRLVLRGVVMMGAILVR
jgi:hypothetical protein